MELRPWMINCVSSIWCPCSLPTAVSCWEWRLSHINLSAAHRSKVYIELPNCKAPPPALPSLASCHDGSGWYLHRAIEWTPVEGFCVPWTWRLPSLRRSKKGGVSQLWACELSAGTLGCVQIARKQLGRSPWCKWQSLKIRLHKGTWGNCIPVLGVEFLGHMINGYFLL